MKADYSMRRATDSDLDAIMMILEGRREWLWETKFSNQWASVREWRHLLCYLMRRGHVWVLVSRDGGSVVGTVTVNTDPDRDFWSDDERAVPALYVSKLATDVHSKGQELGHRLLAWVQLYAASQRIGVLRLDTWKTSDGLRDYYAMRGWRHVRTVDLAHRESGSLFEREVHVPTDAPVARDAPTGQFDAKALKRIVKRDRKSRALLSSASRSPSNASRS